MATALVTGGNRGLGLEVVRQLAEGGWTVLLGARNLELGERARESLRLPNVSAIAVDVTDDRSVAELAAGLRAREPIDALVNNAGASFDGFDAEVARRTFEVNYRGPVRVTDALLPRLAAHASIVMVSSGMGELSQVSAELRRHLLSESLQRADLDALAAAFIERAANVRRSSEGLADGLPDNAYSVSKILLNGFTRVLATELTRLGNERRVNAVCPGWVRTRMGGPAAPRSVERGARSIVWAAELGAVARRPGVAAAPNGAFFRDEKAIDW